MSKNARTSSIVAACLTLMLSQLVSAQDIMTAEQLLERSRNEAYAVAVAMYISGWRDGTSRELLGSAADLRESGGEVGDYPSYKEALGRCLQALEVADLHSKLDDMSRAGDIGPGQTSASAALFNAAAEICGDAIEATLAELPDR